MSHGAGDTLDGRYRLAHRIATGGMGDVWQGTDLLLNRAVAVKTLRADRADDPRFHRRFQHEARAMAALHHPGIADVYDFGHEPGDPYLVMAYVHGQALDLRIAARGRLPVGETMSIVGQVARALQAAHDAGIEHRDVKPGNIIVQPNGTAVLVDFGIAHSAGSAELTSTKDVLGTPHYLAPERLSKHAVGPAADVYALGAVAYHCLAGQPPFLAEDALEIAYRHLRNDPPPLPADVPAAARAIVTTALAKKPADRFPSAAAMADAAERAAAVDWGEATTEPLPSHPLRSGHVRPSEPATGRRRSRRHTTLAPALAMLAVAATSAGLAAAGTFDHDPGSPRPSASAPAGPAAVTPSSKSATPVPGRGGDGTRTSRPPTRSPATTKGSSHSTPTKAPTTTPTKTPVTPTKTPVTTAPTSKPPVSTPTSRPPATETPTTQPATGQPTANQSPAGTPETGPSALR